MDKENKYMLMADVLRSLAHPTRLRIVEQLSGGEKCVQDLQRVTGTDMSTVSRHLSVLKNREIIDSRRDKTFIYYRLKNKFVLDLFPCVGSVLGTNIEEE